MSLAARLQEARDKVKPKFEQWIDTLDDEDRDALYAAVRDGISSSAITIAIRAAGGSVGKETIDVWRRTIG